MSSSALQHLRVLDLTRVRAGPTCCRVLADFGADVIKIEAPLGVDPNEGISGARHGFDMLNLHRNKRALTLNLKKTEGIQVFNKMVANADVVVENFRPGVKDRLGIHYDALKSINPRIILASISGFGQQGPYRDRAGFDQIAQGMGGLMSITGEPGKGPMRAGTAVADSSAGIYAATGILVALAEREKSGEGQWVHTSLLQAQIALLDFQAARYLIDDDEPQQVGNDHPYSTPMGVAKTKDGHINIGVGGDGQWVNLCKALGHPEWAEIDDFKSIQSRVENRDACWTLINPVFETATSAHWVSVLEQHDVPAGPIYKIGEMFDDPHIDQLNMTPSVDHPVRGAVRMIGQPVELSRTPAKMKTAAPDAGEHNTEILQEMGFSENEIQRLIDEKIV